MSKLKFNLQQELLQVSEEYRFTDKEEDVLSLLQKKKLIGNEPKKC